MKNEIDTRYDIKEVEERIYKLWEKSGYFSPDNTLQTRVDNTRTNTKRNADSHGKNQRKRVFSIVLPPPNVTGELHMGHAAMLAVEDIMVRYARMKGMKTLWLPGTDHAAIATQSKVEKDVYKKEGKSRHDLGRDEFLRRVEKFASQSHDTIIGQIKRMGASLDWSREAFTLDGKRGKAVEEAFRRMYEAGLIYRGERIVNWDPKLQTTVSDDEIEWEEEKASFYYLKYGPFEIGTARPETKFGDKYVVVHPEDKRYKKYTHGEKLEVDWMKGKITATVIKDKAVDMKFGTGAMTITPWHDATDFEIAERHKLDREQIIDNFGKLLPIAGEFAGMKIKEARPKILERLEEKGLLVKMDESYTHRLAINSRGGGIIEPQVMKQWFVDVGFRFQVKGLRLKGIKNGQKYNLKDLMEMAVRSGEIKITPKRFEKVYFHWIKNLRDWCISRQIWYGHRIPIWYCLKCKDAKVSPKIKAKWFLVRHGEMNPNRDKHFPKDEFSEPLNEKGVQQIQELAKNLKAKKVDIIVSSDMLRAKQTSEILSKELGVEIIFEESFRERGIGGWGGKSFEDVKRELGDDYWRRPGSPASGIESNEDLEMRIVEVFRRYKKNYEHKNVLIVGHGAAFRMLRKRIMNLTHEGAWELKPMENGEAIQLDLGEKCEKCGGDIYEQDSDTLDTWFSSGLWTFSTLGWPFASAQNKKLNIKNKKIYKPTPGSDLDLFHPTSVLETGYDILFFWVARMILMSTYLLGEVPFRQVYLHGLVRDAQGRKMSKSLGNGIDPKEMADKYGADATRLSLIIGAGPGNDIKLSEDKIRGYRNFATKVWNAARFVHLYKTADLRGINADSRRHPYSPADKRDLAKLKKIKTEVTKYLEKYEFHLAGEILYHYFWHEFADKIIEAAKPRLSGENEKDAAAAYDKLEAILTECLKMLHPFMPFVTEEIWQKMGHKELLMVEKWS